MSAAEPEVPPDQRAFAADANKPSFIAGVHRGDWSIESVEWPMVEISIAAAPRPGAPARFAELMNHPSYPRASAYDPVWVRNNCMGPNALWLIDDLTGHLELQPGQRVLDLGCGTAMTSIFLAREFGVYVHAADLWIRPADNLARIYEAGVESSVVPVEAEAHALPFAQDSFDAIVSVDAYHYFGTDVRYLTYLATFLRSGGTIAVVVPGNETDPDDATDDDAPTWDERFRADWFSFRSATWWARHWRRTFGITVHRAEMLPEGPQLWRRHLEADMAWTGVYPNDPHDGAGLGFVRLIATKS